MKVKVAGAWVDVTHIVSGSGIAETVLDANTILKADTDDTPVALSVAAQRIIGRITGGSIDDLTAAQVKTLLGIAASEVAFSPAGTLASTTVQAAIEEAASEAGGGSAPDIQVFTSSGTWT